ncbi:MAG: biotin transporter BioY [Bacilli bacterium]|nr:biotin transporter BioY [Bacilli bacterium]
MKLLRMSKIALFTSILSIGTVLIPPIPIGEINITLQTLIIMICGLLLSPLDAFIAVVLYLLLGIIGLPVFSGFKSGLGVLLGPSGGYLFSFPIASFLISLFTKSQKFVPSLIITFVFGVLFVHLIGAIFMGLYLEKSFLLVFPMVAIFIPFDIVKCFIASMLSHRLRLIPYFKR